jgi:hypothetical protein
LKNSAVFKLQRFDLKGHQTATMSSLAALPYDFSGKKTRESNQGAPVSDGTPSGHYEWEFRVMAKYNATEDADKWKLGSRLIEGLTGGSFKVAMILGLSELSKCNSRAHVSIG